MKNFPTKNIRELIESDFVTDETRRVLLDRLNADGNAPPRFFERREFEILKAACQALAPSKVVPHSFAASEIDKRLADGAGNGWRYDAMPPDGESYKIGLKILDDSAREKFETDFVRLDVEKRREILNSLTKLAPERFLEELCAEYAEIFYSHPLALEQIGYIGFADKHGWDLGVHSPQSIVHSQENELRMTNDELQQREIQSSEFVTANPKSKIQNRTWLMPLSSARERAALPFSQGWRKPV